MGERQANQKKLPKYNLARFNLTGGERRRMQEDTHAHSGLPRYNLARYNLPDSESTQTLPFKRRVHIGINVVAGGRLHKLFARIVRVQARQVSIAHSGRPFARKNRLSVNAALHLYSVMPLLRKKRINVLSRAVFGKKMHAKRVSSVSVNARSHIGKRMYIARKLGAQIQHDVHIGKQIPECRQHKIMVDNLVLMGHMVHTRAILNTTIPPGGELRLNSDAFTALLNGANVLHQHEGDWIFFDRNVRELILHSGTGAPLRGNVLYNWRFV